MKQDTCANFGPVQMVNVDGMHKQTASSFLGDPNRLSGKEMLLASAGMQSEAPVPDSSPTSGNTSTQAIDIPTPEKDTTKLKMCPSHVLQAKPRL